VSRLQEAVRIQLLGGFEVSVEDRRLPHSAWRLRKARTLVKLLALQPSHRLHRDRVVEYLWPDLGVDAARNNLHQVVHAARRAFSTLGVDGASVLGLQDDLVVLGAGSHVVTDVETLQADVARVGASGDAAALAGVLGQSPHELLPEDAYEPWAQPQADALREWRLHVVMDLAENAAAGPEPEAAAALLAPVISANPLNEPAYRAMMRALARSGRRSEALIVFERLREVLQRELAAEPEPPTRSLYRELLVGGGEASREALGPEAAPKRSGAGNLPAPVTALIGRGRELAEADGILARTRLLTLTGLGGAGKTSLAVELARRRFERYEDGAVLVELGALADGELVAAEMARALQLELPAYGAAKDALVSQLRQRDLLIVLDNCEHLIDTCAEIVSLLLRGCPRVSVLATSREPLRIESEVTWRTPSLALPDPAHMPALESLAAIASVQLFVQHASSVAPGFALTDDNAAAVAEICYRLDGMPLALELAAACVPVLSPQQIAARLGDALTLLNRGERARITRQQTLAATLAWSHDLLASEERVLFRRLSVFAGSSDLDAVEGVCADDLAQRAWVLPALGRLVDTSLVLAEPRGDVTRYRLLETVRQYGAERLRAAGEESQLRHRHCACYLGFAEARDPEQSPNVLDVVPATLDVEHDNLRVALRWALRHEPATALRLAVALWRYWLARGLFAEGRRWLEAVLYAVPEPSPLRVRALLALAVFDMRRGSDHRLAEIGAESVAAYRTRGDPAGLAEALQADAVLAYMRGAWNLCWQRSLQAQELAADCGADEVGASALHLHAMVLLGRGELSLARNVFDDVRAALLPLRLVARPSFTPVMLGFSVVGAQVKSPRLHFEETMLLGRRVGAEQAGAYVLCNLAYLARLAGDLDEAIKLLDEAASVFGAIGDRYGEALVCSHVGCLHGVRGEHDAGRAALARSLQLRQGLGDRRAIGLTLCNQGVLTASAGSVERGIVLLQRGLAGFRETEDAPGRVGSTLTMASVYADAGAFDEAHRLLSEALLESRRIPGNHRATAWGYAMFSDVCRRLGQPDEAGRALDDARERFEALGAVDGTAHVQAAVRALQSRR